MSAVSLVTLHVNVVTVVARGDVAAGVVVAVQDTEGAQAMDGGQLCFILLPYLQVKSTRSSVCEQIN